MQWQHIHSATYLMILCTVHFENIEEASGSTKLSESMQLWYTTISFFLTLSCVNHCSFMVIFTQDCCLLCYFIQLAFFQVQIVDNSKDTWTDRGPSMRGVQLSLQVQHCATVDWHWQNPPSLTDILSFKLL